MQVSSCSWCSSLGTGCNLRELSTILMVMCRLVPSCTKLNDRLHVVETCCCRWNPQEDSGRQAEWPACFLGTAKGCESLELRGDGYKGCAGLGTD